MRRKHFKLSDADKEKISQAVREAEKKTSGEIVPLIIDSSSAYWGVNWGLALAGWLTASVAVWSVGWVALSELLLWQCLGVTLGFGLGFLPFVKRFFLPARHTAFKVHRQCMANFLALGLHETRDRTGILIYLSLLERRVEILADRGIYEKLPKNFWQDQIQSIVRGIYAGQVTAALSNVIGEMGTKLTILFPRRSDDTNELPDDPKLGEQ